MAGDITMRFPGQPSIFPESNLAAEFFGRLLQFGKNAGRNASRRAERARAERDAQRKPKLGGAKRKEIKRREKRERTKVGISSLFGRFSLSGADPELYVRLGGKVFFRKPQTELRAGEQIVVFKQFLVIEPGKIEENLLKSDRFIAAMRGLFIFPPNGGRPVTRLRERLCRAFGAEAGIPDIEQKIFRQGGFDFTEDEYRRMRDRIHGMLEAGHQQLGTPKRLPQTVEKWLRGHTVAPRGTFDEGNTVWTALQPVCTFMSSEMMAYGMRDRYHRYFSLYHAIIDHFTVLSDSRSMRSDTAPGVPQTLDRTAHRNGPPKKRQVTHSEIREEADRIIRMFIDDLSEAVGVCEASRVNVTVTEPDPSTAPKAESNPKNAPSSADKKMRLERGIVRKLPDDLGATVRTVPELRQDLIFLCEALSEALDELVPAMGIALPRSPIAGLELHTEVAIEMGLVDELTERNELVVPVPPDYAEFKEHREEIAQRVAEAVESGEADRILTAHLRTLGRLAEGKEIPEGTLFRMFETHRALWKAMPGDLLSGVDGGDPGISRLDAIASLYSDVAGDLKDNFWPKGSRAVAMIGTADQRFDDKELKKNGVVSSISLGIIQGVSVEEVEAAMRRKVEERRREDRKKFGTRLDYQVVDTMLRDFNLSDDVEVRDYIKTALRNAEIAGSEMTPEMLGEGLRHYIATKGLAGPREAQALNALGLGEDSPQLFLRRLRMAATPGTKAEGSFLALVNGENVSREVTDRRDGSMTRETAERILRDYEMMEALPILSEANFSAPRQG